MGRVGGGRESEGCWLLIAAVAIAACRVRERPRRDDHAGDPAGRHLRRQARGGAAAAAGGSPANRVAVRQRAASSPPPRRRVCRNTRMGGGPWRRGFRGSRRSSRRAVDDRCADHPPRTHVRLRGAGLAARRRDPHAGVRRARTSAMQGDAARRLQPGASTRCLRVLASGRCSRRCRPATSCRPIVVTPLAPMPLSRTRHIVIRPTDVAGATFAIESVRLISRREHLASIPAGVGWQGLARGLSRNARLARARDA